MDKLKIAIACFSLCLGKGGSERVAVNLAEEMTHRGHQVLLLSHIGPNGEESPAYSLSSHVRHLAVNGNGWHGEIATLKKLLLDKKIDVFLSLGASSRHFFWASACIGTGIPLIYSERSDPVERIEKINWNRQGRMAALYGADCIHELLPAYISTIPQELRKKVTVIPNAAPKNPIPATIKNNGQKILLFLGRLCEEKRPLILLDAFCLLADKYPDWNLEIWGHGPLEDNLVTHIKNTGVSKRIFFRGQCDNSAQAYANAQLYCLPSSHEGFPNTVLEAMAAGLPIVGYKSCTALANIIEEGKTGLLANVDSAESLAKELNKLMNDYNLRKSIGDAARNAAAAYQPDCIYDKWEKLFFEMAALGHTVTEKFDCDEFQSRADLSCAARKEWLYRDLDKPMPWSFAWLKERAFNVAHNIIMDMYSRKGLA